MDFLGIKMEVFEDVCFEDLVFIPKHFAHDLALLFFVILH